MAAAKITPNFPGAYSGQVDTWEEEIRDQVSLLPAYEGYRPRLALAPRPPDTIEAEAQAVSDDERSKFGKHYIGVREGGQHNYPA